MMFPKLHQFALVLTMMGVLVAEEWPHFLVEDFQVNENIGSCVQDQAAVASLPTGGYVIVWRDYRNSDADIYAQKFNKDGTLSGGNVQVDRAAPGISCLNPDVIGDPNGGFTVIWEQPGDQVYNIMCRRFDQYGSPISAPFALKVDSQSPGQKRPVIASDRKGGFIVAWQDKRNDSGDIYCQRYDSTATPIRDNFVVNDDNVGEGTQSFPAIASDQDGGFLVVWQDNRDGFQNRIFGQRFDSNGRSVNFNFCVDDDLNGPEQWSPDVAFGPANEYVIVWKNGNKDDLDIWGRRYMADNSPAGGFFFVTSDSSEARQYNPSVAFSKNDGFCVVWQDDRNGQQEIFFRAYDSTGQPMPQAPRRIDDNLHAAHHYSPQVTALLDNEFLITWDDRRSGLGDIFLQRISINSKKTGFNTRVNNDVGSSFQEYPTAVRTHKGEYYIAWTDYRHGGQDIYAQKIDSLGIALGTNFRVSSQHGFLAQTVRPALSSGSSHLTCVWNQQDENGWKVLRQSWDFDNTFLQVNDTINGYNLEAQKSNPHIAYFSSGGFVLVWSEDRGDQSTDWDIYAQLYSRGRTPISSPLLVNFDNRNGRQDFPFVATRHDGGFLVTYIDFSTGALMSQRFAMDGTPLGTNFRVDTGSQKADRELAPAIFDSKGGFIIVWSGLGKSSQGIFFKQYSDGGVPLRPVTVVDSIFINAPIELKNPAVAIDDDDNFCIAWQSSDKNRATSAIYAAYYSQNGETTFPVFSVHKPSASFASQPSIALYDGWLFTAWRDNRTTGQGFDIWASLLELRPATSVNSSQPVPVDFLLQCYPNPFNSTSHIRFTLPVTGHVQADIFDVNGRLTKTLYSGQLDAGAHHLEWQGTDQRGHDVASGLYLCRIQYAKQTRTLKMILAR